MNHPPTRFINRSFLCAISIAIAATTCLRASAAEEETATDKKEVPQYLFVQTAQKVSSDGTTLTLHRVSPITLFFSDRPERITGHGKTEEYVTNWAKGEDSFKTDPPNATLCVFGEGNEHIAEVVVELTKPVYKDGNLSYTVKVLDGELPKTGGACSLFVDVIGRPLTPVSYAGVARRTTRRTVRRIAYY